jgi:hypothetical protein
MSEKEKVHLLHEKLNDVFMDMNDIQVMDERSRDAKQDAILSLIIMRKTLESMGLHHAPMKKVPS